MKIKAKEYATKAHEGQVRKSTGTPMIGHPIRVAKILENHGFNDEVVAAGYLHDTVEDTEVTLDDIRINFGDEVVRIVAGNTENKEHTWEQRKQHTIDSIKTAPLEIKALVVADKLDNLNSLIKDYETLGEAIWDSFKRGREKQAWYFSSVANNCTYGLSDEEIPDFFKTYQERVRLFFG